MKFDTDERPTKNVPTVFHKQTGFFETFLNHYLNYGTVPTSSVATKPILCTESLKYTMLFYYIKMRTSSSPSHPFLQLTGALKWDTVWTSISNGVETTHGQS